VYWKADELPSQWARGMALTVAGPAAPHVLDRTGLSA
jgi:hypothetical protein